MGKCPHCGRVGYDQAKSSVLRIAIENRLTHYGFGLGMTPKKHNMYVAVRTTIMLRLGRAPFEDTHKIYDQEIDKCLELLDLVLPEKEAVSHD